MSEESQDSPDNSDEPQLLKRNAYKKLTLRNRMTQEVIREF